MTTDDLWSVRNVRLTAFPVPGAEQPLCPPWEELIGQPPESRNDQPRISKRDEVGPIDIAGTQSVFVLRSMPTRTDLIIEPPPPAAPDEDLPLLPQEVLPGFEGLAREWLPRFSRVSRLAFGAVLSTAPDDPSAVAAFLGEKLGFTVTSDTRDFVHQVNRRINSKKVPNLAINRLSKWQMVTIARLSIDFRNAAVPPLQQELPPHVELTLDINTVPEREIEIGTETLPDLFSELMKLGLDIAQDGLSDV